MGYGKFRIKLKKSKMKPEINQGGLWKTAMGRIVLDNHNCESFCEPQDKKLMTKEELTNGIKFEEFMKRIN